jgi:hypothetical protein
VRQLRHADCGHWASRLGPAPLRRRRTRPSCHPAQNGRLTSSNCVVICRTCHYSAHQGGRWGDTSIYADLDNLPMDQKIATIAVLYPHYSG